MLADPAASVSAAELAAAGRSAMDVPGLYSWWVDEAGARDLSAGLGHEVRPGLVYAGQAGATRWPSGRRSTNTLWERLTGMHLGTRSQFSTFRRTLAAALRGPLRLASEDDPRLGAWMSDHLRVTAWATPDADVLHRVESAVLASLEPPLNLKGMSQTALRRRLRELRGEW